MTHPHPTTTPLAGATVELSYPELHRAGRGEWWRAVLGFALVALLGVVLFPVVVTVVLGGVAVASGYGIERFNDELVQFPDHLTPMTLAFALLTVCCLVPAVWVAQRVVHGLPFGTLTSVRFRFRWRYFAAALGLGVAAMLLSLGLTAFLPGDAVESQAGAGANELTATAWSFLLVTVFLVPIQAAAEEYAFRGYLVQAWGGVFGGRRVATTLSVLGSALVFALMHGSQEWPVFFDRFAFGVCAAVVVVLTGGLEAAIALHVVNNLFAFSLAVFFGDVTTAMAPSGSTWWQIPVSLVQVVSFGLMAVWVARRMGVEATVRLRPGSLARPVARRWSQAS